MSSAIDDFTRGIEGRSRLFFGIDLRAKHLEKGNFSLSTRDPEDRRKRQKKQVRIDLLRYDHLRHDLDARSEYIDDVIREVFPESR